ncbi:hypothetical protein GCM10023195_86250 [Actinoallomurus liliacearum]|uniref:Uncharacterized protein n=1 Tax=Actinoallomurus liliacearum TaxID=1080073 RepID=A0ABP8U1U4_9ACTN
MSQQEKRPSRQELNKKHLALIAAGKMPTATERWNAQVAKHKSAEGGGSNNG